MPCDTGLHLLRTVSPKTKDPIPTLSRSKLFSSVVDSTSLTIMGDESNVAGRRTYAVCEAKRAGYCRFVRHRHCQSCRLLACLPSHNPTRQEQTIGLYLTIRQDLFLPNRNHVTTCILTLSQTHQGPTYRGADKSLAQPGRKQATATKDFDFHISYL
jgi:hypothetical protein